MSIDGRLLRRAIQRLEDEKKVRSEKAAAKRAAVYAKIPRVREIDRELRLTMLDVLSAVSAGADVEAQMEAAKRKNLELQAEKAQLLTAAGYRSGDIDDEPECAKCGDRGFIGAKICTCLMDIYRDEQRRELSECLKLGEETFNTFSLEYYDDRKDPVTGISPREHMALVFEQCREYARKFGKNSPNLFLRGGTGLGKTFLSACIAKVVSEKGYSVVYDTAVNIFAAFEAEKFGLGDDLGTEMLTSMVSSALYTLINTRLVSGRKTVINSNLSPEELDKRYPPQIVSRLEGEYLPLIFKGRDIRLIKRDMI
jgi:DNA replication protein DnaC